MTISACRQRWLIDCCMSCIRAFLQLAGSSRNLVTASPVMPGGSLCARWASCATASLMPNSRTMARHGALGWSFSACCHRVCAGVGLGTVAPIAAVGLGLPSGAGGCASSALLLGVPTVRIEAVRARIKGCAHEKRWRCINCSSTIRRHPLSPSVEHQVLTGIAASTEIVADNSGAPGRL
jgi:hypothetical protein